MSDVEYLCCPQCGNTDFIEVPATTQRGREYVLHCDNPECTWTVLP